MGFPAQDVIGTLKQLLLQNLIIADHMRATDLTKSDLVRVHASGYIHARILAARIDYIAACALVTPVSDQKLASDIARLWNINEGFTDVQHKRKNEAGACFISYLEKHVEKYIGSHDGDRSLFIGSSSMLVRAREALGIQSKSEYQIVQNHDMQDFDRLFAVDVDQLS